MGRWGAPLAVTSSLQVSDTAPRACQGRFTTLSCLASTYETTMLRLAWPQQALQDAYCAWPAEASQGGAALATARSQLDPARHTPILKLWLADLASRWSATWRKRR